MKHKSGFLLVYHDIMRWESLRLGDELDFQQLKMVWKEKSWNLKNLFFSHENSFKFSQKVVSILSHPNDDDDGGKKGGNFFHDAQAFLSWTNAAT